MKFNSKKKKNKKKLKIGTKSDTPERAVEKYFSF